MGIPAPRPEHLAVPAAIGEVVLPRYGRASLADVVPAAIGRVLGDGSRDRVDVARTSKVVVLVVDGLGSTQLRRSGVAPWLAGLPGTDIDAVFPTTTVASIASIGTGLPPAVHGLVGLTFALPEHAHPLNGLGWRVGLRGGGFDAREQVVPEELQPAPTAFDRAVAAGVATTVVVDTAFPDSGLTRAALRGGDIRTARGLRETLDAAVAGLIASDGPALAYAHHPLVDWAGHLDGPCSPAWCDAVRDVESVLQAVATTLPPDVTVLVTADHGMVAAPEEDVVELSEHPDLLDGVRVLAGEPRVRQLALEDDADPHEVAGRWRSVLGSRVLVATRDEAMPLFGPEPSDRGRRHVGDLVVIARRGTLVHERVDPHGGRHLGQHGGPTTAERLVPLRRVTAA